MTQLDSVKDFEELEARFVRAALSPVLKSDPAYVADFARRSKVFFDYLVQLAEGTARSEQSTKPEPVGEPDSLSLAVPSTSVAREISGLPNKANYYSPSPRLVDAVILKMADTARRLLSIDDIYGRLDGAGIEVHKPSLTTKISRLRNDVAYLEPLPRKIDRSNRLRVNGIVITDAGRVYLEHLKTTLLSEDELEILRKRMPDLFDDF